MKNVMKCMFVGLALMGCSAASESDPYSDVEQPVKCTVARQQVDGSSNVAYESLFKVPGKTRQQMMKNTFIQYELDASAHKFENLSSGTEIMFDADGTASIVCIGNMMPSHYWEYVE